MLPLDEDAQDRAYLAPGRVDGDTVTSFVKGLNWTIWFSAEALSPPKQ